MLHTLYNLGPRSGAEPDGAVVREPAGSLQELLRQGFHRNVLHPVRERRPDAPALRRRLRASPAACPPCASASRCSSSARAPTSPSCLLLRPQRRRGRNRAATRSAPSLPALYGAKSAQLRRSDQAAVRRDAATGSPELYVNALNIIHYMHDKYCLREASRWRCTTRNMHRAPWPTGIAGLSVAADSLSAIKYATREGRPRRRGPDCGFQDRKGEFPVLREQRRRAWTKSPCSLVQQLHGEAAQASHLPRLACPPCPS